MPSNLSVAIVADTKDLTTKLALAQAELKKFGTETRNLASQAVAGGAGIDAGLLPQLQAAAASAAAAKAQVAALRTELTATGAESVGFTASIAAANAQMEQIAGFGKLFIAGAIAEGIKLTAERVIGLATGYAEFGHQLEVASRETGLSTLQLSGLKLAADENSVAFENVTRLLTRFASNIQGAITTPSGPASRALRALGLDTDYLRTHSNDLAGMLQVVSQRLAQFTDGGNKAAIEAGIFGQRMGPQLTPILNQLAEEGFGGLISRAQELGVALDTDAAEKAAKAERAFKDFDAALKGLQLTVGGALLPGLSNLAKVLTQLAEGNFGRALATDYAYAASQIEQQIADLKKQIETDNPIGKLWDQARLNGLEFQLQRIREIVRSLPAVPAEAPSAQPGATPAPAMAAEAGTAAANDAQQMRDLEREINAELRERIDLINQAQQVDAAYYSRLAADVKLARAQGTLSDRQEYDDLVTLENEKFALYEKEMAEKLTFYGEDELAFKQLKAQQEVAEQQHLSTLDSLQENFIQRSNKNAKDMAKGWKDAIGEIESAESQLVGDILTKRQTMAQSLLQISGRLVQTEIANDLKALTTKILLGNTEKALEQGGMIYHLFAEETKTQATLAGDAARTASNVEAAGAQAAADIATTKKSVLTHAYSAAAAVYDDVAQIPYVGAFLAPPAAALAFAAVAAFGDAIPSFDVGTPYVPATGLAMVHQGERIIPANLNVSGPDGSLPGGGGDVHVQFNISAIDARTGAQFLMANARTIAQAIRSELRNSNPSLRPT